VHSDELFPVLGLDQDGISPHSEKPVAGVAGLKRVSLELGGK
jgi:hypothetical protein